MTLLSQRFICGIASNRALGFIGISECCWPLGQLRVTERSIEAGPFVEAFVACGVLTLMALFLVPPVGLVALLVLPIVFLVIPRWSCEAADLRVSRGSMPGTISCFVLSKSSRGVDLGIWLPQPSRLAKLMKDRGITVS